MRRRVLQLLLAAAAIGTVAASPAAGDGLVYYEENGRVVITNTPSRRDVRPLPGFAGERLPGVFGQDLPSTIYDAFIERVAAENGLAPSLVKAVALVESAFDPHAVSPKGARGLMQLMPSTAERYGVRDAFDPLQNLRAGAMHLRALLDEFDGDLTLALAAYNAGSGAVRRHGGVPAYPETRNYVRKVRGQLGRPERRSEPPALPRAEPLRVLRDSDGSVKIVN